MTCLSELICSMHADRALTAAEAADAEHHLRACPACRDRVAALTAERRVIAAALEAQDLPARVPAFRPSVPRRGAWAVAAALGALAAGPLVLARALAELGAPRVLAWVDPTAALIDIGVDAGILLINRGHQLMNGIIETIGSSVVLVLLAWAALALARRRGGTAVLASIVLAALVLPRPGHALEVRRSNDTVNVPAGETIDDTLIALGRRIEIDGTVTGDLIALGRSVVVRGTVEGQVITAAQRVDVGGTIGHGVIGFAQSLDLGEADIARNFIGFGESLTTYAGARVRENAIVFARNVELAGPIDRDVLGFGNQVDVRSTVGGNLTAHGERVSLLAPASIGGNVIAHLPSEDALEVSSGATVGGTVSTEIDVAAVSESEFTTLGFYFRQAVRLAAAFLMGVILLALVPSLRRASIDDGMGALAAAGVGLVAMVATPIIALIAAVTIVGLPVAALGIFMWLVGLYFAKIVVAHFAGRRLFATTGQDKHFALALLVGLLLMLVAVNLPLVGGLLNFLLTITGLGMLVIWFWRIFESRPPEGGMATA